MEPFKDFVNNTDYETILKKDEYGTIRKIIQELTTKYDDADSQLSKDIYQYTKNTLIAVGILNGYAQFNYQEKRVLAIKYLRYFLGYESNKFEQIFTDNFGELIELSPKIRIKDEILEKLCSELSHLHMSLITGVLSKSLSAPKISCLIFLDILFTKLREKFYEDNQGSIKSKREYIYHTLGDIPFYPNLNFKIDNVTDNYYLDLVHQVSNVDDDGQSFYDWELGTYLNNQFIFRHFLNKSESSPQYLYDPLVYPDIQMNGYSIDDFANYPELFYRILIHDPENVFTLVESVNKFNLRDEIQRAFESLIGIEEEKMLKLILLQHCISNGFDHPGKKFEYKKLFSDKLPDSEMRIRLQKVIKIINGVKKVLLFTNPGTTIESSPYLDSSTLSEFTSERDSLREHFADKMRLFLRNRIKFDEHKIIEAVVAADLKIPTLPEEKGTLKLKGSLDVKKEIIEQVKELFDLRFNELKKDMDQRFDRSDQRFDILEKKIDESTDTIVREANANSLLTYLLDEFGNKPPEKILESVAKNIKKRKWSEEKIKNFFEDLKLALEKKEWLRAFDKTWKDKLIEGLKKSVLLGLNLVSAGIAGKVVEEIIDFISKS